MPSDTKPSTDQVLTNTFIGFGFLERWVSRSAIWMPLTPSFCASRPQPSSALRLVELGVGVAGDVEQRLLDEPGHHAGIGAAGGDRGRSARAACAWPPAASRAARSWSASRADLLVEVEAEPRLHHGVDVERADLAAQRHDIDRRGVDRQVDAKALAAAGGQQRHQHLAVIVPGDALLDEAHAVLSGDSPSSCGSMMTKRDLSYSKWRSISGSVPLPIEPKPIMTMGPEIFAWICARAGS